MIFRKFRSKTFIAIIFFLIVIAISSSYAFAIYVGDVNGDGKVDIADLTMEISNFNHPPAANTDQYTDGKINSFDTSIITQKILHPDPTYSPTPLPGNSPFSNLNATLIFPYPATFSFNYSGSPTNFIVDLSTFPDMSSDVYLSFSSGSQSPIIEINPTRWDKYSCNRTLYWRVKDMTGTWISNISSASVNCSNPTPTTGPPPILGPIKVMVIDFNPIIESRGGVRLRSLKNWTDPQTFESQFITDISQLSGGYARYQVVSRVDNVDDIPLKEDNFKYTDQSYLDVIEGRTLQHEPDFANYLKILTDYDICGKVNRGEIQELWLWGGPWFGFYEAIMTGPGAFWTNGGPLLGSTCNKKLNIMGFSYEVGVTNMIHDLGHRAEGAMSQVFGENPVFQKSQNTDWGKFVYACGYMHQTPTSASDYDYGNTRFVSTSCDDWLNYPNLTGQIKNFNCTVWNCDQYDYLKWWFTRFPKSSGKTGTKWNNWWMYLYDYDAAIQS